MDDFCTVNVLDFVIFFIIAVTEANPEEFERQNSHPIENFIEFIRIFRQKYPKPSTNIRVRI